MLAMEVCMHTTFLIIPVLWLQSSQIVSALILEVLDLSLPTSRAFRHFFSHCVVLRISAPYE